MDLSIRPASIKDLEMLAAFYQDVTDALDQEKNILTWASGVYPTRETVEAALQEGGVFIAECEGECIGAMQLTYRQEAEFIGAPWSVPADKNDALALHIFAVHPAWRGKGIGRAMLANADIVAAQWHCQVIRLDVYEHNTPAIHLYESFGYRYVSTVEFPNRHRGISNWYRLYERPVLLAAKRLFGD